VNACEVATPLELVVSVSVTAGVAVANRPLAPVEGAVKVTETPLEGVPLDVTVATSAFVNAVPTAADWPPPLVAEIAMVGGGGVVVLLPELLQATSAAIMPRLMESRIA